MKTGKKAMLAAASVGAAGLAAAATCRVLMQMALDRTPPRMLERAGRELLRGSDKLARLEKTLQHYGQKLGAGDCRTVRMTACDGTVLTGHWHQAQTPRRTVIAMHGWRSDWTRDFGAVADFWHRNDCNVLYAEQRGQGNSGGEHMGFGVTERFDCRDWVYWANAHGAQGLPIYLCGVSMGATTVLMASELQLPPNVCGIVADCGFTAPHDIWKHVLQNNLHLSYLPYRAMASRLYRKKLHTSANACSTTKALTQCKVPVLFIHGSDDRFVPISMTYENYMACAAPRHLLVAPGADHGMSYFTERQRYEAAMRQFWQTYDKTAGAG